MTSAVTVGSARRAASGGEARHLAFDITGMHCAGCASVVEQALRRLPGVSRASVNLALERADVDTTLSVSAIVAAVEAAGYGAIARAGTAAERRAQAERLAADRRAAERLTLVRAAVAVVLTLPFLIDMAASLLIDGHGAILPPWVQVALALPVQVLCGWPFLAGAVKAVRQLAPNMDVLVALGTLSATLFSLWLVLAGHAAHGHALYFEGAAAIITFVLIGKLIEARAQGEARAALTALASDEPASATVMRDGGPVNIAAEMVQPGDRVLVRPGERVPVDGVIVEGASALDESLVTGEPIPVARDVGGKVIAGSLNGAGVITLTATGVGEDTTLARISRLVEAAQTGKAPVQRLVDTVARLFVPAVLLIALGTFLVWWLWLGRAEDGLIAAISVLVISCPCALGLATPVALVAGTGLAARSGIIIRDLAALEAAATVKAIAFDKTGTLTAGTPQMVALAAPGIGRIAALQLAAAISQGSSHPLAQAILAAADAELTETAGPAPGVTETPGAGLSGSVNGIAVLFGSADFLRASGVSLRTLELVIERDAGFAAADSISWLAADGKVAGAIGFTDTLRPYAEDAVRRLAETGITTVLLSGDRPAAAAAMAERAGIAQAKGGLTPAAKVKALGELRQAHGAVGMVGDGINDTPALAAADLGIALGTGAGAAKAAAAITLTRPDLRLVPLALRLARRTRGTIRQNLVLAFLFNVISIPVAAFGLLSPAVAGAAMALSSVAVVGNAARLARTRLV